MKASPMLALVGLTSLFLGAGCDKRAEKPAWTLCRLIQGELRCLPSTRLQPVFERRSPQGWEREWGARTGVLADLRAREELTTFVDCNGGALIGLDAEAAGELDAQSATDACGDAVDVALSGPDGAPSAGAGYRRAVDGAIASTEALLDMCGQGPTLAPTLSWQEWEYGFKNTGTLLGQIATYTLAEGAIAGGVTVAIGGAAAAVGFVGAGLGLAAHLDGKPYISRGIGDAAAHTPPQSTHSTYVKFYRTQLENECQHGAGDAAACGLLDNLDALLEQVSEQDEERVPPVDEGEPPADPDDDDDLAGGRVEDIADCEARQAQWAMFVEGCEATDWSTYDCRVFVAAANNCPDPAAVMPLPDGEWNCAAPMTEEEQRRLVEAVRCEQMGSVAELGPHGAVNCQAGPAGVTMDEAIATWRQRSCLYMYDTTGRCAGEPQQLLPEGPLPDLPLPVDLPRDPALE